MEIKVASCGKDFRENARKYAANMLGNKKTLHIANNPKCYHSQFLEKYVDFNTLEEAKAFPIDFTACGHCFPEQEI